MSILTAVGKWLGYGLPNEVVSSPFTDDSHLFSPNLDELFGFTQNLVVTRRMAMNVPTVAKGRRVIAGNVGRLVPTAMKGNALAPVQPALLLQPERDCSLSTSLTWLADDLMFNPRAWWIVQERDSYGWPIWVKRLPYGQAGFGKEGKLATAWGKDVAPDDVIEFPSIDEGLLVNGAETIRRAIAINRAASHAEDNPVPSVDLHNDGEDLSDDEIDTAIARWVAARQKHGVGYSSKSLKVNAMGAAPQQLLIDGRKAISLELARVIGAPAWALDVAVEGASLTYNNRASRNWELIDLALSPYITAIAGRLSMPDVTPRGWRVTLASDDLTRDDMKTRFDAYKVGIDGKFVTVDQIKAWEGWS